MKRTVGGGRLTVSNRSGFYGQTQQTAGFTGALEIDDSFAIFGGRGVFTPRSVTARDGSLTFHESQHVRVAEGLRLQAGSRLDVGGRARPGYYPADTLIVGGDFEIDPTSSVRFGGSVTVTTGGTLRNRHQIEAHVADVHFQGRVENHASGQIVVNRGSSLRFDDAFINHGSLALTDFYRYDTRPTVQFYGSYTGRGATGDGLLALYDEFHPGVGVGQSTFTTDLYLANESTTVLELGGARVGAFDRVTITGEAHLDGSLLVSLTGGFVPASGDAFNIFRGVFDAADRFDALTLPELRDGLWWEVQWRRRGITLRVLGEATAVPTPVAAVMALAMLPLAARRRPR